MIDDREIERTARVRQLRDGSLVAEWVGPLGACCSSCDGTCKPAAFSVPIVLPVDAGLTPGALISITTPRSVVRRAVLTVLGAPLIAVLVAVLVAGSLGVSDEIAMAMTLAASAIALAWVGMSTPKRVGIRGTSLDAQKIRVLDSDQTFVNNGARRAVGGSVTQ